jgi:hypothetical protein
LLYARSMKTLALLQLLLLPIAGVLHEPRSAAADGGAPSAACNPWSANFWGDAVITSQAAADEYACFRRIVGSLTLIQSGPKLIVMPKLRGILGNLRVVFPRLDGRLDPHHALQSMLPALDEIRGDVELQYARADQLGQTSTHGEVRLALPGSAIVPLRAAAVSSER